MCIRDSTQRQIISVILPFTFNEVIFRHFYCFSRQKVRHILIEQLHICLLYTSSQGCPLHKYHGWNADPVYGVLIDLLHLLCRYSVIHVLSPLRVRPLSCKGWIETQKTGRQENLCVPACRLLLLLHSASRILPKPSSPLPFSGPAYCLSLIHI